MSLIIPAYNEEKYLGRCLDHALKNGGSDFFEIIVVDNASTDNTAQIAAHYPGVRVVREENKGLVRARERGFKEARGDVLAYIDADTQLPPGWAKTALKEFSQNPKLATLSGPYTYYDLPTDNNQPVWLYQLYQKLYWLFAYFIYLAVGYMIVGGNFLIRREVLEKMGGFNTKIEFYGEDTDIARRASRFGQVKFKLSLVMPNSVRRLKGQGAWLTIWLYVTNFLSQIIFHRPTTQKYDDIR